MCFNTHAPRHVRSHSLTQSLAYLLAHLRTHTLPLPLPLTPSHHAQVWDPATGLEKTPPLNAHRQWISWIAWEPLHSSATPDSRRFASASKDATVKLWDFRAAGKKQVMSFGQHSKGVTCVKWGGEGLLYTAGKDREINVWRVADGTLCRTLKGHAHWVNTIALSTDYIIRTGPFNERGEIASGEADLRDVARKR
jgi:ribosome assembly protein 4